MQTRKYPNSAVGSTAATGYTLVELGVVLLILSLLLTLALPPLGRMLATQRVRAASDTLQASLQRARFEALRGNVRVAMCTSASGTACQAQGGWHQGWLIFHDSNNNGQRDGTELVLHREAGMAAQVRIRANVRILERYVSFVRHGGARGVSNPPSALGGPLLMGHFDVCASGVAEVPTFQIFLRQTGHTREARRMLVPCS